MSGNSQVVLTPKLRILSGNQTSYGKRQETRESMNSKNQLSNKRSDNKAKIELDGSIKKIGDDDRNKKEGEEGENL